MNHSKSSSQGDDSLQYLTEEEKACLTFLEETIESLDTAEHSGLSHDESAIADLTKGKAELRNCDDRTNSGSKDRKRNYLVPTPFILAKGNPCIPPKPGTGSSSGKPPSVMDKASKNEKLPQNYPAVSEEVNVTEIPPRPLPSEHLVELRKNLFKRASVESEKQPSTLESSVSENAGETQTTSESKPSRPAVAPKPKIMPSHIAGLNQRRTSNPNADSCLSTSPRNRSICGIEAPNAPRVLQKQPVASDFSVLKDQNMDEDRREALRKLGLLKN